MVFPLENRIYLKRLSELLTGFPGIVKINASEKNHFACGQYRGMDDRRQWENPGSWENPVAGRTGAVELSYPIGREGMSRVCDINVGK
jgi:hypothetical protein